MRARELTEIYKIPQSEFSEIDLENIVDYRSVIKRSKPLPGNDWLVYSVKRDDAAIRIVISDTRAEESVGYLDLNRNPYFPLKNAHSVDMIVVNPQRRGEGIAKSLYGIYLSILKYPLLSGSDQTPGGRRNWLSLSQIPGVTVRGYVNFRDEWFDGKEFDADTNSKKFDQFVDDIMTMGGDYLGERRGVHFFAFDVVPGSGELKPVVKRQLKLYGYNAFTNPGLYAVWDGQ
jgi:hypothetical protein